MYIKVAMTISLVQIPQVKHEIKSCKHKMLHGQYLAKQKMIHLASSAISIISIYIQGLFQTGIRKFVSFNVKKNILIHTITAAGLLDLLESVMFEQQSFMTNNILFRINFQCNSKLNGHKQVLHGSMWGEEYTQYVKDISRKEINFSCCCFVIIMITFTINNKNTNHFLVSAKITKSLSIVFGFKI